MGSKWQEWEGEAGVAWWQGPGTCVGRYGSRIVKSWAEIQGQGCPYWQLQEVHHMQRWQWLQLGLTDLESLIRVGD